jgi:hypothetical protein
VLQDSNSGGGKECRQTVTTGGVGGGRSPRAARQASAACPNSCGTPKRHCAVSRSESRQRAGCGRAPAARALPTAAADQGAGRQLSHAMAWLG